MKNKFLTIAIVTSLILSFFCCKDRTKTTNSNKEKTVTENLKIIGGGNEPGWNIIIQSTKENFTFVLTSILEEGESKGFLTLTERINENQTIRFTGKDSKNNPISVEFKNEVCMDMAANENEGHLTINWNSKILQGCGNYK